MIVILFYYYYYFSPYLNKIIEGNISYHRFTIIYSWYIQRISTSWPQWSQQKRQVHSNTCTARQYNKGSKRCCVTFCIAKNQTAIEQNKCKRYTQQLIAIRYVFLSHWVWVGFAVFYKTYFAVMRGGMTQVDVD